MKANFCQNRFGDSGNAKRFCFSELRTRVLQWLGQNKANVASWGIWVEDVKACLPFQYLRELNIDKVSVRKLPQKTWSVAKKTQKWAEKTWGTLICGKKTQKVLAKKTGSLICRKEGNFLRQFGRVCLKYGLGNINVPIFHIIMCLGSPHFQRLRGFWRKYVFDHRSNVNERTKVSEGYEIYKFNWLEI